MESFGSAANPAAPAGGNFVGSLNKVRAGWTVGAGAEYAFTRNLSLKAEYLYVDLGSDNVSWSDPVLFPGAALTYNYRHTDHIVRAGLNWKFDWAAPR